MNQKFTAFLTLMSMALSMTSAIAEPVENEYISTLTGPSRCNFVTADLNDPQQGQYDEDCREMVDYTIEKTLVSVNGSAIPAGTPFPEIQTGDTLRYIIDVDGTIPINGLNYADFYNTNLLGVSSTNPSSQETNVSFDQPTGVAFITYNPLATDSDTATPTNSFGDTANQLSPDDDAYDLDISLEVIAIPGATTQYICNFVEVGATTRVAKTIDPLQSVPANQFSPYSTKIHTEACVQLPGVEPNLIVAKSVDSNGPFVDGDIVEYTFDITLENYVGVAGFDIADATGVDITLTDTFDPQFISYVLDVTPVNTNGSASNIQIADFTNVVTMDVELVEDATTPANAIGTVVLQAQVDYQDHDSSADFCNGTTPGSLVIDPSTVIDTSITASTTSTDYSAAEEVCITRTADDVADPEDLSIYKGIYDSAGALIGGLDTSGTAYSGAAVTLVNGQTYSYKITIASSDSSDEIGGMYLEESLPAGANVTNVTGGTYSASSNTLFVAGAATGPVTAEIFFTVDSTADASGVCAPFSNTVTAQAMRIRETSSSLSGTTMTSSFNITSPSNFTSFFDQISFDVEIDGPSPSFNASGTPTFTITQGGQSLSTESVTIHKYGLPTNVPETGTVQQFRVAFNFADTERLIVEADTNINIEWTLEGITGDNVRVRMPNELEPFTEAYASSPSATMLEYPIVWSPLAEELVLDYSGEFYSVDVNNSTGLVDLVVTNEIIYNLTLDASATTVAVGHIDLAIVGDHSSLTYTLNGEVGTNIGGNVYEFPVAAGVFTGTQVFELVANGTLAVGQEITDVDVAVLNNDVGTLNLQIPVNDLAAQNGTNPITWIVQTHPGFEYWFNSATAMADMANVAINGNGGVNDTTTFLLQSNGGTAVVNDVTGCTGFQLKKTLVSINGNTCSATFDCSTLRETDIVVYSIELVQSGGAAFPESVTVFDVYDPFLLDFQSTDLVDPIGLNTTTPPVGFNALEFMLGDGVGSNPPTSATFTFNVL